MHPTCEEIKNSLAPIIDEIVGDGSVKVIEICSVDDIRQGCLVFASERSQLDKALSSSAAVIVTKKQLLGSSPTQGKTFLMAQNVPLAQARVTQFVVPSKIRRTGHVHPTAVIANTANVASDASVGPFAVIGEGCQIGSGTYIGPHCILEDGSRVGDHSTLIASVYLGPGCQIGSSCTVHPHASLGAEGFGFAHDDRGQHHRIPQNGIVIVEDHVEIGSQCTIDRATYSTTRIRAGTKMDTHIHVAHNCEIGKDCLITAGTVMGGSSRVGDNVVMGGNVTITDHVTIANNVQLGGLSGVANDVRDSGAYGGYPLQPMKDYLRTTATMLHLVQMRKDLQQLIKKWSGSKE